MDQKELAKLIKFTEKWHTERRRTERAFTAASRLFLSHSRRGEFVKASNALDTLIQVQDEILTLAGCASE